MSTGSNWRRYLWRAGFSLTLVVSIASGAFYLSQLQFTLPKSAGRAAASEVVYQDDRFQGAWAEGSRYEYCNAHSHCLWLRIHELKQCDRPVVVQFALKTAKRELPGHMKVVIPRGQFGDLKPIELGTDFEAADYLSLDAITCGGGRLPDEHWDA